MSLPLIDISEVERAQGNIETFAQEFFAKEKRKYDYGELFEPLYFDLCEFVGRKGKRIRPLFLMQTYRAMGGTKDMADPTLLRCAFTLELLHTFILIHDDIIDRSEKRRGLPTFHKLVEERLPHISDNHRIGQNVAVVMGDIVFAMAFDTLQQVSCPAKIRDALMRNFTRYATDTGCGEIYDILLGVKDVRRVSRDDIVRMYHLKTTRYTFEAPCIMGALLAGASNEKIEALTSIAKPLGLAFQIQNDLQEFKHLRIDDRMLPTDILEGKKTLLLCDTYANLNEIDQSFFQMCLSEPSASESKILKIRDLIDKSGAIPNLQAFSSDLLAKATRSLEDPVFTPEESAGLRELVGYIKDQVGIQ